MPDAPDPVPPTHPADPADLDRIRSRLAEAGLPASPSEIEALGQGVLMQRSQLELLWALEAARYAEPALVFPAEAPHVAWG